MVKANRREGLTIDIEAGIHKMISDVNEALGGKGKGPSPHEILEAALAACTSITVQMYANRKGWKLTTCNVEVKFFQEDKNAIVIERAIEMIGEIDDSQKQRLFEIAEKCPIHEVLIRGSQVVSHLK